MKSILTPLRVKLAGELKGRIMDCGAGEGLFNQYLRQPGNEVISLDIDAEAVRKLPGKSVVASCTAIPFADSYFDAVWACAIIEHVSEDVLPEMIRVTRPGGRIIAITPNRHSPFEPVKALLGLPTWRQMEGHVRLYTTQQLRFYGDVYGETRFLPFVGWFFWTHPQLANVLIVDIRVTEALKQKITRLFSRPDSTRATGFRP